MGHPDVGHPSKVWVRWRSPDALLCCRRCEMDFKGRETIEACRGCRTVLLREYWRVDGEVFCGGCADGRRREAERAVRRDAVRGVVYGVVAAALMTVCEAGLWPVLARLTWPEGVWSLRLELQSLLALVAGTVVGVAVYTGSRGRGGWVLQGAAVLLVYAAYAGSVALAGGWRCAGDGGDGAGAVAAGGDAADGGCGVWDDAGVADEPDGAAGGGERAVRVCGEVGALPCFGRIILPIDEGYCSYARPGYEHRFCLSCYR